MDKKQENQLIDRIKSGEDLLYKTLVEANSQNVFSLIFRVVGSREIAEEISQDVFVKAFFSLKNFRGDSSFSTWLYRIAYNLAVSQRRLKRRTLVQIEAVPIVASELIEAEVEDLQIREYKYSLLDSALEELDPEDRFLIISFYKDNKSMNELTVITGLSLSNVKVKLYRIRKKIYEHLEKKMEISYGK